MTNKIYLTLIMSLFFSPIALAEITIIVHPSNGNTMTPKEISRLFLGKSKSFPNGDTAAPLVLNNDTAKEFNTKLLGKSASQLKAYWSKLVFTGKATPPQRVSEEQMFELIKTNPNMIGYTDSSTINAGVKAIGHY
ncbi:MAG: hypothetical protein AB1Y36_04805 [Cycloclasticus sp.]